MVAVWFKDHLLTSIKGKELDSSSGFKASAEGGLVEVTVGVC